MNTVNADQRHIGIVFKLFTRDYLVKSTQPLTGTVECCQYSWTSKSGGSQIFLKNENTHLREMHTFSFFSSSSSRKHNLTLASYQRMNDFMEYCLKRFYRSSGWNEENQYSNLCSWSRAILDFHTPKGLSLVISKLPTPQFKPSYTLNALPTLNGSLGYLYTSRPLDIGTSATVDFQDMIDRFRIVMKPTTSKGDDYKGTCFYQLI